LGTPLTKDMAPYWEAVLAPENLDALKQLDIAYVSATSSSIGPIQFTLREREMLRRLVDAGVTLWIDNPTFGLRLDTSLNALFVPLDFGTVTGNGLVGVNMSHPLLAGAFRLTAAEIAGLGDGGANRAVAVGTLSPAQPQILQPVVVNGTSNLNAPYIAA